MVWTRYDIPCEITNIEVTSATPHDENSNTYDLTYEVTWVGTLTQEDRVNGTSYPTSGNILTQTVTLPADGTWTSLTATFDDEPTCTSTLGNAYFDHNHVPFASRMSTTMGPLRISTSLMCCPNLDAPVAAPPTSTSDGDDSITVADILLVLSAFGETC